MDVGGWKWRLLALSPKPFAGSRSIVSFDVDNHQRLPYSMTNQGLELRLPSGSSTGEVDRDGYRPVLFQTPVSIAIAVCDR